MNQMALKGRKSAFKLLQQLKQSGRNLKVKDIPLIVITQIDF